MVLREIVQDVILNQILNSVAGMKFLILDDFTTKIVSGVIKMQDLSIDGNVIDVRHISINAQEPNKRPVVYFLVATEDNVRKFLSHFDTSDGKSAQYGKIHLFFTSHCSDQHVREIKSSKVVLKRLQCFKEVNLGFIRCNDFTFDIQASQCFTMYYNPKFRHLQESTYLTKLATQVISICVQIGHFPSSIRYSNSFFGEVNKEFAEEIRRLLGLFHLENRDEMEWKNVDSTILILDRSFDTITPVLHDMTTEALARDFLAIGLEGHDRNGLHQNEYTYSVETNLDEELKDERVLYLDDSNEFWNKLRYSSIVDAISIIQQLVEDLRNQERLEQGKVKDLPLAKLRELMSKYPEQRRFRESIGALSHLVESTIQLYCKDVIECEQFLACNLETEPDEFRNWKIVQDVLKSNKEGKLGRQLSMNERIRLLYLYARSMSELKGISMEELTIRFEEAEVPEDFIPVLSNMSFLGTPIIAQSGQWGSFKDQNRDWRKEESCATKHGEPVRPDTMPSIVDWCPNIYHLVKDLVEKPHYNFEKFPALDLKTRPRKAMQPPVEIMSKGSTKNSRNFENDLYERGSFVVFIAGGMTYGEAKYALLLNELFQKTGGPMVFFGSSQMINPDDFLEKVNSINSLCKYNTEDGPTTPIRAIAATKKSLIVSRGSYLSFVGETGAKGPVRAAVRKGEGNRGRFRRRKSKPKVDANESEYREIAKQPIYMKTSMNMESKDFDKGLVDEIYGTSNDWPRNHPLAEEQNRPSPPPAETKQPNQQPPRAGNFNPGQRPNAVVPHQETQENPRNNAQISQRSPLPPPQNSSTPSRMQMMPGGPVVRVPNPNFRPPMTQNQPVAPAVQFNQPLRNPIQPPPPLPPRNVNQA